MSSPKLNKKVNSFWFNPRSLTIFPFLLSNFTFTQCATLRGNPVKSIVLFFEKYHAAFIFITTQDKEYKKWWVALFTLLLWYSMTEKMLSPHHHQINPISKSSKCCLVCRVICVTTLQVCGFHSFLHTRKPSSTHFTGLLCARVNNFVLT